MGKKIKQWTEWAFHHKISRKIGIVFFLFILTSIFISFLLYQSISAIFTKKNLDQSLYQTLLSIETNIENIIENADNNYNLLLKVGLGNLVNTPMDETRRKFYDNYLFTIVDSYTHLDAIYITDLKSHLYGIDKNGQKSLAISEIAKAPWYEEVLAAKGGYVLVNEAGGIFEKNYKNHFVSLIRTINDLETQMPIGFAILNIPTKSLALLFEQVSKDAPTQMILLDEKNQELAGSKEYYREDIRKKMLPHLQNKGDFYSQVHKRNIYIGLHFKDRSWKLLGTFPISGKKELEEALNLVFVLLLLGNVILMIFCALILSRSVKKPIYRLIYAMQEIKEGELFPVKVEHPASEIGILESNYNHMIREIKALLSRLVAEQKVQRQMELSVLQEQIKPHFLYNTLDTIRCMVLTQDPMEVYDAIETLGSFYRQSLSGGNQIITIEDELKITKDYITLLTFRYSSLFEVSYQIDPHLLSYKVPKLFLQPLIENSVYHGIKPLGEEGQIILSVGFEETFIVITVFDNGVGIKPEVIDFIQKEQWSKGNSIGLFATLERMRIFYGKDFQVEVVSGKKEGTTLTLKFPKIIEYKEEEKWNT